MISFTVPDISCGHCVSQVTKTLHEVDPQATVAVDLPSRRVDVESTEPRERLAAALTEAGYPPA
jgi:copper chaperone